jgi:acylphosphatase
MIRTDCIITLTGSFKNTGFGFSCLQKATSLSLCGEFEYLNEKEVEIIVSGGKESIQKFYNWCINQSFPKSGKISVLSKKTKYFNEFQIINQL